jgi:hypothetical protein
MLELLLEVQLFHCASSADEARLFNTLLDKSSPSGRNCRLLVEFLFIEEEGFYD